VQDVRHHTFIHENMRKRFTEGFHYDAHPMGMLMSAIAGLSTYYPENFLSMMWRMVGSSDADPYSSAAAATGALYGPRHGGANEAVIRMLGRIGTLENVEPFVESVKRGEELLWGFGHRVYKSYDPRAAIVKSRNLYPNVDFYTGLIYQAMNFPLNMFTVLFTIGRMPGWLAHWQESLEQNSKISRPRQIYTGEGERAYTPISGR
jgi:citrate synthase